MKHKGWWANTSDKQYPIRSKRNSGNRSIKWRGRRTRNTLRQLQEWTRKVIQQTRRQQSKLGEWRKTKQQQKRTRRAYITLRDNNIVSEMNSSVRQGTEMEEQPMSKTAEDFTVTLTQSIERHKDWNHALNPQNNTHNTGKWRHFKSEYLSELKICTCLSTKYHLKLICSKSTGRYKL